MKPSLFVLFIIRFVEFGDNFVTGMLTWRVVHVKRPPVTEEGGRLNKCFKLAVSTLILEQWGLLRLGLRDRIHGRSLHP